MNAILGQVMVRGWGIQEYLIAIVVITAAIGVAWLVMTKVFEVTPPAWLIKILWIVLAAVIAVVAIRFLFTL